MQNYVLKLIYTLFSALYSMGLRLKCRGSDWKAFFLFLAPDPLPVIIILIRWWETMTSAFGIPAGTKPQILRLSALGQRAHWGCTLVFTSAISSFLAVLLVHWERKSLIEKSNFPFQGRQRTAILYWFTCNTSQGARSVVYIEES